MRKAMVLGLVMVAGTLASPAFADEFTGFRLGLNIGSDKLESDFMVGGDPDSVETLNIDRFSYGLSAGWALNKWLAVEGALSRGTEFNESVFRADLAPSDLFMKSRTSFQSAELTVVGTGWIGSKFAFFGRAGISGYKAEERVTTGDFTQPPETDVTLGSKKSGAAPVFGLGIQTVLDHALLRLEYKQTEFDDLKFVDAGDATDPDDDFEVFNLKDSTVSSLTLSIVWTL